LRVRHRGPQPLQSGKGIEAVQQQSLSTLDPCHYLTIWLSIY